MKSNPKLKSGLPGKTSTLHLCHRQKGPKIPTPATKKKDQKGAKITIKKDQKSPKRRSPPSSDLLPLLISISTSLSHPIYPGGDDESCSRAGGGEWLIILWKKEKEKENNKIRSKDSEKDQRDEREKRVLGRREFWGKKKIERAREREMDRWF
jgi:hypothetical protein